MKDFKISITTPTTKSRAKCLNLQIRNIKNQTYNRFIKEWIIVSADKNWNKEDFNLCMQNLQNQTKIKIIYKYLEDSNENIGFLRNSLNDMISSETNYILAFDDDDYYQPQYIEHSIKSMRKTGKLAAGCTSHIMYDVDLQSFFQFKGFAQNHTVNNCLSYHRNFLKDHKYNDEDKFAEEKYFLKDFTSELVQLNPNETVIQMVHAENTFNKRKMILTNKLLSNDQKSLFEIDSKMNSNILKNYIEVLNKPLENEIEYDIIYYLGFNNFKWSPYQNNLGGSEQAVLHLSTEWIKKGKNICVVGDFDDEIIQKTRNDKKMANYVNFNTFKCSAKYKNIILWRPTSLNILKYITADKICIDLHDNCALIKDFEIYIDKIEHIFFKSDFHKNFIKKFHKDIETQIEEKSVIIENGVRIRKFTDKGKYKRIYNRFCYTSCYTRGLYQILMHLWPVIRGIDDKAELHIYYGMNLVKDEKFKKVMEYLLKQPGIYNWGKQSLDVIKEEKCKSTFHLYISNTYAETDCIAIRESACCGCIPLLSNNNVFKERPGIHYEIEDTNNRNDMTNIALKIIALMRDEKKVEEIRQKIKNNDKSWLQIAKKWQTYF
ncbi:putative glycosyltransferase [Aureococcus anophagefferens virus]|uniref:Putative glycosyltransferase n=1 Tax=Aureococcus anophagefferens virus TaxID=1474867 RepID=A0A076FG00_9VIRU|nr:putative glycosyltransferase [Aureococcus anophagefferens virus]AII17204.1 putative glycosyltransferase [Aureococcus anophagefferens virus]UOG94106.1 transferase [Aureococcus anophagefferens virus]